MYFRCLRLLVSASMLFPALLFARPLTVCADPDNLPFSSRKLDGFDNRIASLLATQLHTTATFHWARMGRGFIRNIVNKGECDVLMGVPAGMHGLLVTRPYYRSTYVFITRDRISPISSFDDERLQRMKIGVQVLDDDYAPPARALARRGLTRNIVGFDMDDPGRIVRAVARGEVDTAIVWGPLAGYYSARQRGLHLSPVTPEIDFPMLPFAYEMAIGVRRNEPELFHRIDAAVANAMPQIQRLLRAYNVPMTPVPHSAMARAGVP